MFLNFLFVLLLKGSLGLAAYQIDHFPISKSGWLGGDAAYSRLISKSKRIWLFGDTLVGELKDEKRIAKIVRNSVAVEKNGEIKYYWGNSLEGIFKNYRSGEWYWPGDLFQSNGKLYVFLRRMQKLPALTQFSFKFAGNDLAEISNPNADPSFWKILIRPFGSDRLNLGAAVAVKDDYLFMLAESQSLEHSLFLVRLALKSLDAELPKIEFFQTSTKSWVPQLATEPIIKVGAPEASLAYVPAQKLWRVVLSPAGISPEIMVYRTKNLETAWRGPEQIFSCSEIKLNSNYFCYAAKEIDTRGSNFFFTYNVNSSNFLDLSRDPSIYIPRMLHGKK